VKIRLADRLYFTRRTNSRLPEDRVMSEPIRVCPARGRTDLETVTSWPLVVAAVGAVVAFLSLGSLALSPAEPPRRQRPPVVSAAPHERCARVLPGNTAPMSLTQVEEPERAGPGRNEDEPALERSLLAGSREPDLDSEAGASLVLWIVGWQHGRDIERARKRGRPTPPLSGPLERLLETRDDLKGLPLLAGKACQTSKQQAQLLGEMSVRLRRLQGPTGRTSTLFEQAQIRDCLACLGERTEGIEDRCLLVRPLEQMIQTEPQAVRAELVRTLAKIEGREATQALARRAVFDLSRQVRRTAVEELSWRDAAEARDVFLAAFRYPWPPAADHAATALVALDDEVSAPRLRELLDEPDPALPYRDREGRWKRNELVRVNHLRNCLLCHPPSFSFGDPVTGPIPMPGVPLVRGYYEAPNPLVVRADVVYFRQDFSAMHPVEKPNRWPKLQRFDYLVQACELTRSEAETAIERAAKQQTYSQREAARWVLEKLESKRFFRARR
jgi:hypothetical protein